MPTRARRGSCCPATTRLIAWPSTGTKPSRAVNGSSASPLFEGESRITSDSTSAGRCSASAVATLPPIEWPDDRRAPHPEAVERRCHEPRLALHRRSRPSASRSRRVPSRSNRITWWSRASAGDHPVPPVRSTQANPCSSTTAWPSAGPSSRTWRSPPGRSTMRPPSAFAASVSRSVTIVLTASSTRQHCHQPTARTGACETLSAWHAMSRRGAGREPLGVRLGLARRRRSR